VEGAQFNGPPFPATASAEGAQFNGPPSLRERVRVRGFVPEPAGPLARLCRRRAQPFTPRPLPTGEGANGPYVLYCLYHIQWQCNPVRFYSP